MRKVLALIGIVFLLASLMVPLVSADADLQVYGVAGNIASMQISTLHPSASSSYSAVAMKFLVSGADGYYLTKVNVVLSKFGSPNANLTVRIWGSEQTSAGLMNATLYGTSITKWNTTVISTDMYSYPFNFNGTITLVENAYYWAEVYAVESATLDADNYIITYRSGSMSTNWRAGFYLGAYGYSSYKMGMNVYANVDPIYILDTDPTPTPYPSGSGSTGDTSIQELTDIILPWLVPLLICLIPALLGYKFVGELGFFIGLNVGVILAYVTLAGTAYEFPLWGIILVGVMDVAVVLMRR